MKRLTERSLDYCTQMCPDEKMFSCAFYKDDQAERCLIANMYDRLAYYEDLEEHGRLVVLPCKVGDTIYRPSRERDEVWDWEVAEVHILSDYYGCPISFVDDSDNEFFASDIGKTVFLTSAEAEKAMEVSEDA